MKAVPQPPEIETFTARFFPAARPSRKLVLVLHGLGDSMAGFFWLPEALGLGHVNYLMVNAPRRYAIGFSWYDLENPEPGVLEGRELLGKLFAELESQGWPGEEIVIFGFSQGCLMTIDFALRHPRPLAGLVGISGYALLNGGTEEEIHPCAKEQSWLITHGAHDPMLPLERTHAQMERLRAAGIPIEWHEFHKEHTVDFENEVPLLREWIGKRLPAED